MTQQSNGTRRRATCTSSVELGDSPRERDLGSVAMPDRPLSISIYSYCHTLVGSGPGSPKRSGTNGAYGVETPALPARRGVGRQHTGCHGLTPRISTVSLRSCRQPAREELIRSAERWYLQRRPPLRAAEGTRCQRRGPARITGIEPWGQAARPTLGLTPSLSPSAWGSPSSTRLRASADRCGPRGPGRPGLRRGRQGRFEVVGESSIKIG